MAASCFAWSRFRLADFAAFLTVFLIAFFNAFWPVLSVPPTLADFSRLTESWVNAYGVNTTPP